MVEAVVETVVEAEAARTGGCKVQRSGGACVMEAEVEAEGGACVVEAEGGACVVEAEGCPPLGLSVQNCMASSS